MRSTVGIAVSVFLAAAALAAAALPSLAQDVDPQKLVAQSEEARERFVKENMLLDAEESAQFWPLYREYRAQMEPVHDRIIDVVIRYADLYPHVTDEQAIELFDSYMTAKDQEAKIQAKYFRKIRKQFRPKQAIRFAQIENKLDAFVEFDAAMTIPLVN